jgi:lipoprotein-anchoring transpeptidase ErfK/SrfK
MIWRAGNNYGYNNNAGTLSTYNATYCDWSINDASGTVPGTYYITSKRANGTTDGTLILLSSGVFDAWSSGVGYASNYSNLFRIEATVPTEIESVSAKRDGKIYDLSGRQVAHPTRGIYIIDGRKVYIK